MLRVHLDGQPLTYKGLSVMYGLVGPRYLAIQVPLDAPGARSLVQWADGKVHDFILETDDDPPQPVARGKVEFRNAHIRSGYIVVPWGEEVPDYIEIMGPAYPEAS